MLGFVVGFIAGVMSFIILGLIGCKSTYVTEKDVVETYHWFKYFPDSMKWGIERKK